ncbi:hypothetical protein SAMN05414139_10610 [Burkholderia sp. D7]|nr:hypothetical protein SAMN05414139_10610 [Burkholderia sp. D7]
MIKTDSVSTFDLNSSIDAGVIVLTRDGRALFGWRDIKTGLYHGEDDGVCIPDAVGAIEFVSDLVH